MKFPSKEWAEAYCRELNSSPGYRRSGKGWLWPILFVVKYPDGRKQGFILKLENGECKGVEWYDDASKADAPYVLEATLDDWLDVISGKVNPLMAIMRRKLVLAKGNYSTLMRFPVAALEMVKAAQRVPIG
ncbi:MAG: SCP2 sterol-binding domain-containing protein [Desulfurococcales archaeon]|nr:SCP2 sterol-binding domain-containing protein [Desulfurococcales archaeon]